VVYKLDSPASRVDVFCSEAAISDPAVGKSISTGIREVAVHVTMQSARVSAVIVGKDTLRGHSKRPLGIDRTQTTRMTVHAYCHAAFLPGEKRLCMVAGRARPSSQYVWISTAIKAEPDTQLRDHQAKAAEFEEEIKRKRHENEE
jgi:hypothetical protein